MSLDLPDFTLPISIIGYIITTIPIDIKAQTLGTVAIDIKSQSMENVSVNIAASTITLSIDIKTQSLRNLNVIVQSGVGVLNQGQIVNGDFEQYYGTTAIDHLLGWIDYGICTKTVTECFSGFRGITMKKYTLVPAYNGIFQTISPSIPTDNIANFTIMWQSYALEDGSFKIELAYSDGTKTTQTIPTTFTSWTSATLTYNVGKFITGIRIYTDHNTYLAFDNLYLDALSLNYREELQGIINNVNIDIVAQTIGNVSVNIAAQAVDINIKTSGGANIVIDKLTQTAYVARRSTLSNNGETPSWLAITGNDRKAKYFPRGCRGFLTTIEIYCRNTIAGNQTITVYISPQPNMGYVASATISVPAFSAEAWRNATFNRMWNYDSLFIFCVSSSANVGFGYDTDYPRDTFYSSDAGATWVEHLERQWYRANLGGETVGDLPVSGTINTIEISNKSSRDIGDEVMCPNGAETVVASLTGSGVMLYADNTIGHANALYRVYCDGIMVYSDSAAGMSSKGFTASTPGLALLHYGAGAVDNNIWDVRQFEFKRSLEVRVRNDTGGGITCTCILAATLVV